MSLRNSSSENLFDSESIKKCFVNFFSFLESIKINEFESIRKNLSEIFPSVFRDENIFNNSLELINTTTSKNIFAVVKCIIMLKHFILFTKENSKKRILFMRLNYHFSKMIWSNNMNIDQLVKFVNDLDQIKNLIFDSFDLIIDFPEENKEFKQMCYNLYKNLIVELVFYTMNFFNDFDDSSQEVMDAKGRILLIFESFTQV